MERYIKYNSAVGDLIFRFAAVAYIRCTNKDVIFFTEGGARVAEIHYATADFAREHFEHLQYWMANPVEEVGSICNMGQSLDQSKIK